ncbi:aspartyl protease family protein [Shewanella sp.]|uniref:aspartyl protease family protein n=1 Tax=Shewanella sp. TaxID=50422 RepID=UPI003A979D4B
MLTSFLTSLALMASAATMSSNNTASNTGAEIRYDNRGRPVIATQVNEQGPYYMVVDTAAETSLIVPALAKILKVDSVDSGLTINGATGKVKANMYPIDHFSSPLFNVSQVGLLELPNPSSTPAAGIIGMDLFADSALVFNFNERRMTVEPSGEAKTNEMVIPAIKDNRLLIRVMITLNGVEIPALIDTGAAATIANSAVLKALGWQADDPHLVDDGDIRGATTDTSAIKKASIDTVKIGGMTMRNIPIRFIETPDEVPANLILGSDILNSLIGFTLDFPRQEFRVMFPMKDEEK